MAQPVDSSDLKSKLRFHGESVYGPWSMAGPLRLGFAFAANLGSEFWPDLKRNILRRKPCLGPNPRRKGLTMSLHIEQREREGIIILDLKGPLTLGHGGLELRDRLPALRQSGKVNILLNFKDVSHIDSTGLGTLVFGLARLRKAGGRLALVNLDRSHLELFLLTKLTIAFEFFDGEHDAVNSFFQDRALRRFDILNFVQHEDGRDSDHANRFEAAC
jgi:anti-sigma B factor antagonist